ncbi:hypothetical protein [Phormidesmis sp. 146-33]
MVENSENLCPNCQSNHNVIKKLILIGAKSPKALFGDEERCGYRRKDQLAIDECNPEVLKEKPLEQFLEGYFCTACDIGFVNDILAIDAHSLKSKNPR